MSAALKTIGELVADVLAKRDEIDLAEAGKKKLASELEEMERDLSDLMDEQGLQSLKAADGRTVYKSRDLFVSVAASNRDAVVEACRVLGLDDLIKTEVPTAQLKSRIREWMGDLGEADQIPEQLRPLVNVHEEHSIRVRRS